MTRTWKQMTTNMLVLVAFGGQIALAAGNRGGLGGHAGGNHASNNGGMSARATLGGSSAKPVFKTTNGGGSLKSSQFPTVHKFPTVQPGTGGLGAKVGGGVKFPTPGKLPPFSPTGPIGPIKPLPPIVKPLPPIGPIGPVKPPVKPLPPIVTPLPPIGPIGPIKPLPPVGPIKPPVNPLPPIGPFPPINPNPPVPPTPPINPNPPMPPVHPPHHGHCHPHWHHWVGWCGGWFNCPVVVQPCALPLVTTVVEVVPVPTTVVVQEVAVVREIDLSVKEVRVVDQGDAQHGPLYRVFVTNKGKSDLDVPTRVALFGANEGRPTDDTPRAIATLKSLRVGDVAELDVRMPATAHLYPFLIVAVEVPENYKDTNEQDNMAQGEVARLPVVVAAQ